MFATTSSLAAAAAIAILALSAGQQPAPAESAVLELERAWDRALAARDTGQLGRLLADD